MPIARTKKNATGLSIRLDQDVPVYTPGSTIEGTVDLNTAANLALGEVTICLYGRAKVHFVQHHGQGESHWRGRAPLFRKTLVLYEGKHTHKPGSFSWPFQFTIPQYPDEEAFREKQYSWKPRPHYISTNDYIPDHQLPPSFNFRKWGFGYRYHAFIEYVLETYMKEPNGTHLVLPPRSRRSVMPLMIRGHSSKNDVAKPLPGIEFLVPPIAGKKPKDPKIYQQRSAHSQTTIHTVRTPRLESGDRYEQLSFKKRASSIVNPNRVPSFTFAVTVTTPDTIEILDASGIPLFVYISPIKNEQTSILPNMYPKVRVDSLSITVRGITYIRFRSITRDRHEHTSSDIKLLDRARVNYEFDLKNKTELNVRNEHLQPHDDNELGGTDVAKLTGLSSILSSTKFGRGSTENPLVPSFESYIISRQYQLRWQLDLDVLGERVKVESRNNDTILVTDADVDVIKAYLQDKKGSSGDVDEEDEVSDSDDEEEDRLSEKMGNLLSSKRKTKAKEALEEQSNLEEQHENELPVYEDVPTGAKEEILPKYKR